MNIVRSAILALVTLLALAPLTPLRAQDLPVVRVGKPEAAALTFMAIEIGERAGIWKNVGINVQGEALKGDAQIHQALTAGSIDIGIGSGPGLAFLAKGVPALAIAALSGPPDQMSLIVGPNSPIKTIRDVQGKRIGVTTHGAVTEWLTQQIAVKQGWPVSSITIVPLGDAKGELAGLKTGAVDGFVSSVDVGYDLIEHHQGSILLNFGHEVVPALPQQPDLRAHGLHPEPSRSREEIPRGLVPNDRLHANPSAANDRRSPLRPKASVPKRWPRHTPTSCR